MANDDTPGVPGEEQDDEIVSSGGATTTKRFRVHCRSLSAMMQDAMSTEKVIEVLFHGNRPQKAKDITPEKVCEEALYRGPNDEFGFPGNNLYATLVNAGRYVKIGRAAVTKSDKATILPSFLTIDDEFIAFLDQTVKWKVDARRGQNAQGTAVAVIRPKFLKWEFETEITVTIGDGVDESTVKELFRMAGSRVGLCSYRPAKGGSYGRFEVVSFDESPAA